MSQWCWQKDTQKNETLSFISDHKNSRHTIKIFLQMACENIVHTGDPISGKHFDHFNTQMGCVWSPAVAQWTEPQLRRLVAGHTPQRSGSHPGQVMWDQWRTKWYWGRIPQILPFLLTILITLTAPLSSIILSSTLYSLTTYSINKRKNPKKNKQYFKIFTGLRYKLISYADIYWFEPRTITCLSRLNAKVAPWSSFQIFTHPPLVISFLSHAIHYIFCSWKSIVK
jgi:hypothetical protein